MKSGPAYRDPGGRRGHREPALGDVGAAEGLEVGPRAGETAEDWEPGAGWCWARRMSRALTSSPADRTPMHSAAHTALLFSCSLPFPARFGKIRGKASGCFQRSPWFLPQVVAQMDARTVLFLGRKAMFSWLVLVTKSVTLALLHCPLIK